MATLIDRLKESHLMVQETNKYYNHLTSTIAVADISQWASDIKQAEERRLVDPAVMDILGAKQIDSSNQEIHDHPHITPAGENWCRLALSVEERQIDIQDRVRRLGKEPRENDRQEVQRSREILIAELSQVFTLERKAVAALSQTAISHTEDDDSGTFDNLDDEIDGENAVSGLPSSSMNQLSASSTQTAQPSAASVLPSPPERQLISMPSNCLTDHPLRAIELSLRIHQAERYLNALREAIAEKSFNYSHVMRDAPKKVVRTRARAVISKLNDRISVYSRIYNRCRVALVRLGANQRILDQFQILKREDVKASTAILDPNRPGASSIRLSWIWQSSVHSQNQSPDSVRECMLFLSI